MAETRTPVLRGGAADVDLLVSEDNSTATLVWATPEGDYRLETLANGGGHIAFMAHKSPNAGIFPANPEGDLSVPPG